MSAKFVLSFLFFFCFSAVSWAATPKHYVFLVHGIGASPTTFGKMADALKRESNTLDPQTDWQFINFAYPNGSDSKDVVFHSRELSNFIAEKFQSSGGLNSEDKFSLIMHSQGGLVGLNFVLESSKFNFNFHPELSSHLDAFVTLSTPYWGAKMAVFANRIMPVLSFLRIPLSEKFGSEELTDMELASDSSAALRETLIDPANQEMLKTITQQSRFLVFAGVTERLNLLAPFVTGKNRYEDDTAVPIPSSHLDFIYYKDEERAPASVEASSFKETHFINNENSIVVNAFHASPFPQKAKWAGIAKVPDRCVDISYSSCDHPTYPSIVQHLFKLQRDPSFIRDLTSFAIDLKINLHGKKFDRKKLSLSFKALTTGLKIDKDVELYNKVERWSDSGDYRMYHTGYIDPKKTSSTLGKVQLVISAPGFPERVITVPVKAAQSTFIELDW
jgi:pimeloyl-ACP methyl ester carboxylesterase